MTTVQAQLSDNVRIEIPGLKAVTIPCEIVMAWDQVAKFAIQENQPLCLTPVLFRRSVEEIWELTVGIKATRGESPFDAIVKFWNQHVAG